MRIFLTFWLVLIISKSWSQYLNPNGYPLVSESTISLKTVDHNSESFLVTIDSTVFHFFRQDPGQNGGHTGNGGRIMMRTSNDNGDTWSTPITIYNSAFDDRNIHGGRTEDGRIILTFREYDAFSGQNIGYFLMYSDDKGINWNGPNQIYSDGTSSGTNQIFGNNSLGYYNIIYSTNYCEMRHSWDGISWDSIVHVWDYRMLHLFKISEASFTYLGNGVIIGFFRNDSGVFGENYLQVESYDYGLTWSELSLTNIADGDFCPSPWIFFEPNYNDFWVIAADRRGNFPDYNLRHEDEEVWLYKMSPDEILGNPQEYYPFLKFLRPKPTFYRFYGYPVSTKTPDGNYLILYTESEYRNKGEWAYLYQFKIVYKYNHIETELDKINKEQAKLFPNPATDNLFINNTFSNNSEYVIYIYNELGELVLQKNGKTCFGDNFISTNIETLAPGIYKYIIQSEGVKKQSTFVKT